MSILSNDHPEVLAALNAQPDPRDLPNAPDASPAEAPGEAPDVRCGCPDTIGDPSDLCPVCQAAYDAWLIEQREAEALGVLEILPEDPFEAGEPCGQLFNDGPLPPDAPF